jgi:hypothetical protein
MKRKILEEMRKKRKKVEEEGTRNITESTIGIFSVLAVG